MQRCLECMPHCPRPPPPGIVRRRVVEEAADWFIDSFTVLRDALPRHRVAMIGSGGRRGHGGCALW